MIYLFIFLLASFLGIIWVYAIDKMHDEHPDYKGHDFMEDD